MQKLCKWGARIAPLLPLFALFLAPQLRAQNISIFPSGPTFQLNNLVWGGVAGQGNSFNNAWIFTPLYNGTSCINISVLNNNPANNHTFNVVVAQTTVQGTPGALTVSLPSNGWIFLSTSGPTSGSAFVSSNSAGATFTYSLIGSTLGGATQLGVLFTNGATQAGSPDTANVIINQSQGACNLVQNSPSQTPNIPGDVSKIANVEATSAANTAVSTLTPISTYSASRSILFSVSARCSAGTAQLTVKDGATQIWSTGTTEVTTTTFRFQWSPGLSSSPGNQLTVTLSTCGAANTGTLDTQATAVLVQQ